MKAQGRVLAPSVRLAPGVHPEERQTIEVTIEAGVVDDHGTSSRRQVTVMTEASWNAAIAETGREAPWTTRRANVLVTDVDLGGALPDGQIDLGEVTLKVGGEVVPCGLMDAQVPGLSAALVPDLRGGVYCQVIEGGSIAVGDQVEVTDP